MWPKSVHPLLQNLALRAHALPPNLAVVPLLPRRGAASRQCHLVPPGSLPPESCLSPFPAMALRHSQPVSRHALMHLVFTTSSLCPSPSHPNSPVTLFSAPRA